MDRKIEGEYMGLPYRGPALNIKNDDSEDRLPIQRSTVRIRTFRVGDDEERKEYEKVCQMIADGLAAQSFEDIKYDEKLGWIAMVRWVELWYGPPKDINYVGKN